MPGFTMHYLFGVRSIKEFENDFLTKNIKKHSGVFALGTQGPDLFFYYVPSKFLYDRNPGSIIHKEKSGIFFRNFISNVNKRSGVERQIGISYLCGFLAHYSLDQYCHPYVYARTEYQGSEKGYLGRHIDFESQMDIEILKRLCNYGPSGFNQSEKMKTNLYEKRIVASLLYQTYSQTYPDKKIYKHTPLSAVYMFMWGCILLRDKEGWKKSLVSKLERVLVGYETVASVIQNDKMDNPQMSKMDVLNLEKKTWKNPWDTSLVSDESVFELWGKSKRTYSSIMKLLELFLQPDDKSEKAESLSNLMSQIRNMSYHTGFDCSSGEFLKKY